MPYRFIDFYEEPQTFFLVLEKVPGGELFERIIAEGRFMEGDARDCIRSLLEALEYCHSQQIVHRDIKPENILFANLDATDRTVKVPSTARGVDFKFALRDIKFLVWVGMIKRLGRGTFSELISTVYRYVLLQRSATTEA